MDFLLLFLIWINLKNFLEPTMFCHLAVLNVQLEKQGKRPEVHAKQKGFKNFFRVNSNYGDVLRLIRLSKKIQCYLN